MSRRRRQTLIFVAIGLPTWLAPVTVHGPVAARMRIADNAPSAAPLGARPFGPS